MFKPSVLKQHSKIDSPRMKLRIFVNPSRLRRWHLLLAERLASRGMEVAFAFSEGGPSIHPGLGILQKIERSFYNRRAENSVEGPASARIPMASLAGLTGDMPSPDYILDLTVTRVGVAASGNLAPDRILSLLFDGNPDESAAIAAILKETAPVLRVVNAKREIIVEGLPAIERSLLLSSAFDYVLIRSVTMILKAFVNIKAGEPLKASDYSSSLPAPAAVKLQDVAKFGASIFARKATSKLRRLLGKVDHENQDHWRVGWRRTTATSETVSRTSKWPDVPYSSLPDDNARFYADPFIFRHNDTTYVFCEEFPYDSLKGVISYFTISDNGKTSTPKKVLECDHHLSYPFIFERDGEIWMIPETYTCGRIELYRAESFPDKWVFDSVLIDGIIASDATLFEKDGTLWLFIADHDGGSSWDVLSLWHAETLKGPWTPHVLNPVLIDAASARPAGKIAIENGRLIRPAQVCTGLYGGGIALKEITRLDKSGYSEREIVTLLPHDNWNMVGVHTLNSDAGIEVIDLLGERARPG